MSELTWNTHTSWPSLSPSTSISFQHEDQNFSVLGFHSWVFALGEADSFHVTPYRFPSWIVLWLLEGWNLSRMPNSIVSIHALIHSFNHHIKLLTVDQKSCKCDQTDPWAFTQAIHCLRDKSVPKWLWCCVTREIMEECVWNYEGTWWGWGNTYLGTKGESLPFQMRDLLRGAGHVKSPTYRKGKDSSPAGNDVICRENLELICL